MKTTSFSKALAVWPTGRSTVMNDFVLFRAIFTSKANQNYSLHVTGSTLYRIKIDGSFLAFGPTRTAKGYFRVDELPLTLQPGEHVLEIEVLGCNINSYFHLDQPSFIQAEVLTEKGDIVCWTGRDFTAYDLTSEKPRKVMRYSLQRMFSEYYSVLPERKLQNELSLETFPNKKYIVRDFPLPAYTVDTSYSPVRQLHLTRRVPPTPSPTIRHILKPHSDIGFKAYDSDELTFNSYDFLSSFTHNEKGEIKSTLYQGRINNSGFINLKVNCTRPGFIAITFVENCPDMQGLEEPFINDTINGIVWHLNEPGTYHLESLEPYTFKFAEIFMFEAEGTIETLTLREYKCPVGWNYQLKSDNQDFQDIFKAARESFAANAVDGFTDCPSRERANWLCDSFFTARTSFLLTGGTDLERPFLENFALAEEFSPLPEGALPMLYPGDHPNGVFIPNWPLWLILQVEDYWKRSSDRNMLELLKDKLLGYATYLDTFCNSDGLLEKLPSWIFVEWSKANEFVQDVNYPSNMLYASALDSLSRMYQRPDLHQRAEAMRETIRRQSWNGQWFCDHAVRQPDGTLSIPQEDITETCQYYAFFFNCATPESHPDLWSRLIKKFGPSRQTLGLYPEIYPSNAFIGNYMRLDLLSRAGMHAQVLEESKGYFKKMADATGTLWEHDKPSASCCHGFTSYIIVLLDRAKNLL